MDSEKTPAWVEALEKQIDALAQLTANGFASVHKEMDERFNAVDDGFKKIDGRFDVVDQKLERLELSLISGSLY